MDLDEKISGFLARAELKPLRSRLEPYRDLIHALRKRHWTYQQITAALRTEFGLSTAPSTIHAFVKVRARRRNPMAGPAASSAEAPRPPARPRFHIEP